MLAVKLVVHGLVEFIQNFSKKNHDTPQVWKKPAALSRRSASKFLCFSLSSFQTSLKQKLHHYGAPSVSFCYFYSEVSSGLTSFVQL